MNFDALLDRVRHRAPPSLDFDGLVERVQARNLALIADWKERLPGSVSAVLEVTVRASGHPRRRLRRYQEFREARGGHPGILFFSRATMLGDYVDLYVIQIAAAAARADVFDIDWRLLTVSEALATTP